MRFLPGLLALALSQPAGNALAASPGEAPKPDPSLLTETASCQVKGAAKQVLFIKQWHLSPAQDTTDITGSKSLPQYENQKAIYLQLDRWIADGKVSSLLAEGCPAPRAIDGRAPEKFNGWSMRDLEARTDSLDYPDLVTNVAYKLEAKWKGKLHAICGDNASAIKKELLAFSDARGIIGYLTRLEQYRGDPERAQGYLDDVIRLFHMKKSSTVGQAISRLNIELKKSVDAVMKWNDVRNAKLVEAIVSDPSPSIAVVFGGAHAEGVRELLEKKGIACEIYEPVAGYQDDESDLLAALKKIVNERLGQNPITK